MKILARFHGLAHLYSFFSNDVVPETLCKMCSEGFPMPGIQARCKPLAALTASSRVLSLSFTPPTLRLASQEPKTRVEAFVNTSAEDLHGNVVLVILFSLRKYNH